jgi:universal stress protein E
MEDNIMQRFKDILCVVTLDSIGRVALERAVALADNNQARLTVIEVIDELPRNTKLITHVQSLEELQAKIVAKHRKGLEKLVAPWSRKIEIQTKVLIGIPFLKIIREILRNGHDLVIKTAESGGLLDRVFGSDDMHLLRKCPCPVWLIKQESPKEIHKILTAVDVDDYYSTEELNTRHQLNLQILEMATSLALSEFAELHIVHAWIAIDEDSMRGAFVDMSEDKIIAHLEEVRQHYKQSLNVLMNEVIGKLGQDALEYLKPQKHLLKGYPREKIPVLAKEIEADLVVMGTVARTGISGFFMGNTAETILNQLDCSVLAIKPQGFKTPVTLED